MGAYLSKPIVKKETEEGDGNNLYFAASSMQGWRVSQEDAHNCITELDDKASLFAVYDGHGGAEVAVYLSRHFPDVLKSTESYKAGNWHQALHDCYLKIDAQIKEPETIAEIQRIAKNDAGDDADNIADYEEENVGELYEEATMPIEKLMAKYNAVRAGVAALSKAGSSDSEKPGSSKSLLSTIAAAVSACSSSKFVHAATTSTSIETEEQQMSSSSTTCTSTEEIKNINESQTDMVKTTTTAIVETDAGECSSSSSTTTTLRVSANALSSKEIDNTAEAERATSEDSPPEPVLQTRNNNNGDAEPCSSTNEGLEENEAMEMSAAAVGGCSSSSHVVPVNGSEENVEPDSTEDEAKAVSSLAGSSSSSSSLPILNGDNESTSRTNGDTEVVADSTQSENIVKISIESPKRKGKVHPQPVAPIPQPTRSSARRKVNDVKVYKDFINEHAADDDSDSDDNDDEVGQEKPFMNDSDSDEDEETCLGNEEESSDDDDEDDDEEEDDEDEADEDNRLIQDMQEPGYDSGSTAVVALMKWEGDKLGLWVANAGDSRCVVCRDGVALEMSHDHKPEEEIEARRIIKAGGKVTNDGRVNGGLNLSRALGDHSYKQNKTLPSEEQMITPVPDIRHEVLDPLTDQFVVLACDGVWNSLSSQEVVNFVVQRLEKKIKISEICEQLFDACLAPDTSGDGTGCDNMTAIIVQLQPKPGGVENNVPTTESREQPKRRLSTQANAEESKRLKTESD